MKPISIIIPALNEEHYLPRLLQSIVAQDYTGEYEVIIVDGRSEDRTIEVAKQFTDTISNLQTVSSERGTSRQRNHGARLAKYDNFVFVDADTVLPPGTLNKFANHFSRRSNFIALPFIRPDEMHWYDYFWFLLGIGIVVLTRLWRPVLCGMCLVVTRDVHERIGGFNEHMTHAEDADYGFRAHRAGAHYQIFWRAKVYGSARRLERDGSFLVAKTYLKWYIQLIFKGPNGVDSTNYDYGNFKDKKV